MWWFDLGPVIYIIRRQTAPLRWQSGFLDLNMTLNLPTQHCPPLDVSATPPSIRAREARLRRRVSEEV